MLLFGFLFNLHKLGEAGHGQHLVDFSVYVGHLELAALLHHGTHGLLNDTQTVYL